VPNPTQDGDVTALLAGWNAGDSGAFDTLLQVVYQELKGLAAKRLRHEAPGATMQPTALVHEVYLQMVNQRRVNFENRAHFFGAVAHVIRRILVDRARGKNAQKRGRDFELIPFEDSSVTVRLPEQLDLVELNEALNELRNFDPKKLAVVELRYFTGLSVPETADVLGISTATVKREWAIARAWLYDRLKESGAGHVNQL